MNGIGKKTPMMVIIIIEVALGECIMIPPVRFGIGHITPRITKTIILASALSATQNRR